MMDRKSTIAQAEKGLKEEPTSTVSQDIYNVAYLSEDTEIVFVSVVRT